MNLCPFQIWKETVCPIVVLATNQFIWHDWKIVNWDVKHQNTKGPGTPEALKMTHKILIMLN